MAGNSKETTDHEEIKRWAEARGGQPAVIDHPNAQADKRGIRIDFPGKRDDAIKDLTHPVSWNEFFRIFDDQQLLLAYDDDPTDEDPAMWYHFEPRVPPPEANEPETGNPPRDADLADMGPRGYEEEADNPEGDWPEGSEPEPGMDER